MKFLLMSLLLTIPVFAQNVAEEKILIDEEKLHQDVAEFEAGLEQEEAKKKEQREAEEKIRQDVAEFEAKREQEEAKKKEQKEAEEKIRQDIAEFENKPRQGEGKGKPQGLKEKIQKIKADAKKLAEEVKVLEDNYASERKELETELEKNEGMTSQEKEWTLAVLELKFLNSKCEKAKLDCEKRDVLAGQYKKKYKKDFEATDSFAALSEDLDAATEQEQGLKKDENKTETADAPKYPGRNYDPESCQWASDLPRRITNAPGCGKGSVKTCVGYVVCNQKTSPEAKFVRMSTCRPDHCNEKGAVDCTKDMYYWSDNKDEGEGSSGLVSDKIRDIIAPSASKQ